MVSKPPTSVRLWRRLDAGWWELVGETALGERFDPPIWIDPDWHYALVVDLTVSRETPGEEEPCSDG